MEKSLISEEGREIIHSLVERAKTEEITILIVDDNRHIKSVLQRIIIPLLFKKAKVRDLAADEYLKIEPIVTEGKYDLIILGGMLRQWPPHPDFKQDGINLIQFILASSINTCILSISGSERSLLLAQEKGVHAAIHRLYLNDFLQEFKLTE